MSENTEASVETSFSNLVQALVELVRSGMRPDVLEAQRVLLQRLSTQGDVFPARIPAPLNITEVGGYLNLLERAGHLDLRSSAMAGALGIAGPAMAGEALAGAVPVGFIEIANDRPHGPAQASIPPLLPVRADFHAPLLAAREALHAVGCLLPLRARRAVLPASQPGAGPGTLDASAVMAALGRSLSVFPGTVLVDPAQDALAIARPAAPAGEPLRLVARELDGSGSVGEAGWVALRASSTAVANDPAAPRRYLEVAPILEVAGWVHPLPPQAPSSRSQRGSLAEFINLTGLVEGETRLGEELALLFTPAQIARSALSTFTGWVWDGAQFQAPA
jgi:hypothetical protein